jgi:thymidine phosphorylase
MRSMVQAQRLRRLFEYVARHLGLTLEVVITDGRQPIGNGIGPVLEARDVMQVLHGDPQAPQDLRAKALHLAGRMIECDPQVRGGEGIAIARDILESGRALARMQDIIQAQGATGFDYRHPALGALSFEVLAPAGGVVIGIDNLQMARIARLAGAPKVKSAGVDLVRKLGDAVAAGDVLYRVHAAFHADLAFARAACKQCHAYALGDASAIPRASVEF